MFRRTVPLVLALALSSIAFGGQLGKQIPKPVLESPKVPTIPLTEIRRTPRETPPAVVDLGVVDLIVEFRETAAVAKRAVDLQRDLVKLEQRMPASEAVRERARVERTFTRVLFGASVTARREMIPAIEALPYVEKVHLARKFEVLRVANSPLPSGERARVRGGTSDAAGSGVKVAVIDTGIDYQHPALGLGFGHGHKVVGGWDFANDDADPMDDHGHGTHVAGIIAANGDGLTGVAPDVSLYAYKVIKGSGFAEEADIIAGVERTVEDGIDIANMSLGGFAIEDDPIAKAVEDATAAGVLFCIANGNGGGYGYVSSPAIAPSAISVGAIDRHDKMAEFSARGPSYDYGIKPEVVALGVDVLSSIPGGKKLEASGTSMAAPHVAGVAALVKSLHPEWTPAELKAAVITTSRALQDEVMVVGAGHADPNAASAISTLALPAVLSFGRDDAQQAVWTTTRSVTLRNLSAVTQTLTPTIEGLRDGVSVRVTPEVTTLAAGESATVSVELAVTNTLVPAPREGSLSYGGRIQWNGGTVPVNVPWAFVKGTYIRITEAGRGFEVASVIGESGHVNMYGFMGRTRVFWPLEKVDVVVAAYFPTVVAVYEQVDLAASPDVTADFSEAYFTITPDTTDETGNSMVAEGRECHEKIVLSFPQGRKVGFEATAEWRPVFRGFSPRIRVNLAHTCGDPAAGKLYAALHEPMLGLGASVISTLRPQWLQQDVEFTPGIQPSESKIDALAMMRFPGPNESYYYDGGSFYLMRGVEPRLKIFFTKSPDPQVDLVTMLEWWGQCRNESLGHNIECPVLDSIFFYLDEEKVIAENDLFLEVSPMGYQLPRGETITFGRSPVWPHVRFDASESAYGMVAFWIGALGERLVRDTINARASVYDSNGTLLHSDFVGFGVEERLPPGRYRVESVDPELMIAGLRGKATFTGWLETTREDFLLPLFTGLRIVDEDERQVTIVDRDADPSLLFSVADLVRGEVIWYERVPPNEEATRVEYRVHRTGEWRPLPAQLTARHYPFSTFLNGGTGTMYRVDLGAVTSTITGPVDLRITVEDQAGNSSELRLEPALWVGQTMRRRGVRH
jgi:subtilisin family serine protease